MQIAFRFSTYYIGILVALGYVINVVFQPITGRAAQKFEPGVLLPIGISTMAASMILFAISDTFAMMGVSIVIMRLGSSFFHPIGANAISVNYSGNRLDTAMGIESAFGNLGIVFSFALSAPLYLMFGWSGPFYIYAILQVATVAITIPAIGRRLMIAGNSRPEKADNENQDTGKMVEPHGTNARRKYLLYIPLFFVVTAFISGGSNSIFGNFGNLLLYHNGFPISISNDLIAIWVAFAFLGAVATGRLTGMLSRMGILAVSYLLSGASALGFAVFSGNMLLSAAMLSINGFFLAIKYPATYSELSDVASMEGNTGPSFGMLFSSQIIGASIFGYLSGYFSGLFGLASIFELASVLLLLSVGIVFIWKMRFRPRSLSQ